MKKFLTILLTILVFVGLLTMAVLADTDADLPVGGQGDASEEHRAAEDAFSHDCPGSAFTDMPAVTNWAHKGIEFCLENGLMNGVTDTMFRPEGTLTRGQLVTILYRVAEQPKVTFRDTFSDVKEGKYYAHAVIWAANNNIVNGFPDGTFRPKAEITREQIAAILYRFVGEPAVTGTLNFPDGRTVSKYAVNAMLWANQAELINGIKSNGITRLAPRSNATRAQIASITMRFLEKYDKDSLPDYGEDAGAERISLTFTKDKWPIVDGATAFLPFYQEMAARMLGISTEEAVDYILCSTTDFAYPYLWQKKVDLVFCLRPSEAQVQQAAAEGVVFEEVPFANEGFVFFVNKDNPVDSITVQQLHDIYAGKITNWKELGGNDEEIIAYQRTEGSGSQTGLYLHVIDPEEVQEPPHEKRIGNMAGIIDAVAGYKNAAGAIGYSYRYFVTNMHYDEQIKLLKVEGIYPDYASIADGSYPLISDICAVYREDEPADSAVRKIAAWCSSTQGAMLAKELGYVPTTEAIGRLYKPDKNKPDDVRIDYADGNPCPQCTVMSTYGKNNLDIKETEVKNVGFYIQISGLKNKTVQSAINKKIYDTFMELSKADYPPYPGIRTRLALFDENRDEFSGYLSTFVEASFNNILSVMIYKYNYYWSEDGASIDIEDIRTLNLDMSTGKEIFIGDLFADNVDGIAYINEKILEESAKPEAFDEPPTSYFEEKNANIYFRRAFEGINFNQKYYIDQDDGSLHIILDYENPEIANIFSSTDYAIDLHGIHAYESRFMTTESLFTDETYRPCLFRRILSAGDDNIKQEYVEQWSEGRNISFRSTLNGHDARTERLAEATILSDERLAKMKAYVESKYDACVEAGYKDLLGEVEIESNVYAYGDYTNVYSTIWYRVGCSKADGLWDWEEFTAETESYCLDKDSDEPIELKDIFKPGCDSNAILEEVVVRNLKQSLGNKYSENTYRAIFRDILANLDGFFIQEDSLFLFCPDFVDILSKRSIAEKSKDYYLFESILLSMSYTDIGMNNLIIFHS